MPVGTFTAVMHKDGSLYVAECPEVGTVSQGKSIEEAVANLRKPRSFTWKNFRPRTRATTGYGFRGPLCLNCLAFPEPKPFELWRSWGLCRHANAAAISF